MQSNVSPGAANLVPIPLPMYTSSEELIGDHLFLYDQNRDMVYQLNDGASVVWLLCDGQRDLESIASEIEMTYEIPRRQALAEVQEAIEQFQELGLLESRLKQGQIRL